MFIAASFFFFYLNKFIPDREFDTVNAKQKFQIHHYNHLKSKYLLDWACKETRVDPCCGIIENGFYLIIYTELI